MSEKNPRRRPITRAFRKRMILTAFCFLLALVVVLLALLRLLSSNHFALAACVLIPSTTLAFNLFQRRAYVAQF